MNYIVYKVTFPNDKVYIGITSKGLEFRKKKHYSECFNKNTNYKFHNALRKYTDKEIWEVIDTAKDWETLCSLEQIYIQFYDSYKNGYNSTLGGDGSVGLVISEETKQKMRGPRPQTSKALKGKKKSKAHCEALSKACKGRIISKKARKKISEKMIQRNSDINYRNKVAKKLGSSEFEVRCCKTNKLIGVWVSQRTCAKELNIQQSHVSKCLRNVSNQHKGFKFNYLGEKHASI